ncbi:universal stress protein [Oceanimonas baumannii]|uniref:Nucleotide-binding universal stress UspA family protein n=1 Tax=Oceanimonas baumannii TaxID=129578 RepID=A0A235CP28_9GAMM|nr:universal stress protein [Oceanimonas baumannii]MCC4263935.1 universal stress protein [Oceanimonas baumannii]OYD25615.1 universal stress family protein [Oceanimonas baumannii]TDW61172.1 nucleotide-binding universal stress UspA family protein [Oceanimonas baumannii]
MLPQVNRILYCTDLSKNASYAFQYAVYLAKQTGADIHILKVVEKLSGDEKLTLQSYILNQSSREEFLHQRLNQAKTQLQERQDYFWEHIAPEEKALRPKIVSCEVVEGYPEQTILQRSKELECDLIIMGAHEKGWLQTLLGSVAKNVLRESRIPTLIVPRPEKTQS